VLFLALIANGYNILGLNPLYQQITLGGLILLAVGVEPAAQVFGEWRRFRRKPSGGDIVARGSDLHGPPTAVSERHAN
jgi:hypothetical protein